MENVIFKICIFAKVFCSRLKQTDTYTHSHTQTHARSHTHVYKQGVALHILVSGISSQGARELRFFGATAQIHETNFVNRCEAWRGHLIRQHKMSFYKFCGAKN